AAHPDDEVLGCGGYIARLRAEGHAVDVAFATSGVGPGKGAPKKVNTRRHMAKRAADFLGGASLHFSFVPGAEDNRLDALPRLEVARAVESLLDRLAGRNGNRGFLILLTHHPGDLNVDHRRLAEAALVATRPGGRWPVSNLLFFETPSSTEWSFNFGDSFLPNFFVAVAEQLEAKCLALEAYHSEVREFPHPRSREDVSALARWRGGQCGLKAAEAFVLARGIMR
ncbi:MAG: PIG-L deacetylase family protein, partial [Nitrospinota bacterium]